MKKTKKYLFNSFNYTKALFSYEKFLDFATAAFLFVYGKYYSIIY